MRRPPSPPERDTSADVTARFSAAQRPRPLGAVLRVAGAAATPAEHRLTEGKCVIGSGPASDIVIAEPTVSRAHVELELVPEGIAVRDLGSRNGTYYRGQRVERMVLAMGGRLSIGGAATLIIEADTAALEEGPTYSGLEYRGMLGASAAMRRIFGMLSRLEGSLVTVLIEGESGVGKELIARALHDGSRVAGGPFVVVNCGAIPRDLVASELFGHRRGAFTGAVDARRGAFELAHGGSLFLDEIGELPLDVQPVLLRALESGEVRVVGSSEPKQVEVRVIAATNRDLEEEVRAGRFREDLFYRLAVVRARVPPLRDRREDVAPLALRFAHLAGLDALGPDVIALLEAREWPGNARELRNAVQAYAALGALPGVSTRSDARDAPGPGRSGLRRAVTPPPSPRPARARAEALELLVSEVLDLDRPYLEQRDELVEAFNRAYLEALLARTGGNQTAAARIAGLDRTYLGRLLAKYGS